MIRVLVVDDEPLIATAHVAYVERLAGFVVAGVAHTGAGALRAAAQQEAAGTPVDLVLLDLGLPDASGIEVCGALRTFARSPDVIAITSARDLDVVRSAVSSGVLLYLLKPFTFAAFRDKLTRYAAYREQLGDGAVAVTQRDVDRAMATLRSADERAAAPKGTTPQTLEAVAAAVRDEPAGLSAAQVGAALGVSRVTAWRYLERLADDGVLTRHEEHGRAGRPQVRYRWAR
ncbi:response regulator [Rhodococcus aerolatus]